MDEPRDVEQGESSEPESQQPGAVQPPEASTSEQPASEEPSAGDGEPSAGDGEVQDSARDEAPARQTEAEIEQVDQGAAAAAEERAASPAHSPTPQSSPTKKKGFKDPIQLSVVLLEGKSLSLEGNRKVTTEAVIDPAHHETQTLETDFFSVYFYDNHELTHKGQTPKLRQKIFLIPRRQLKAQFSSQEKEQLSQPWQYQYGVKFYVPDPNNSRLLKDDHSRFLYCLQLCDDIRANRIHVDRETAIRLTALMLQGKLGDYDEDTHQSGYYNQFPQFQLLPDSFKPANYEAQIIEVHKAKAGYTPAQADAEFLSIAKDLSRYGEHLFLAKTMRDGDHEDCQLVTIGNGCRGISVYFEGQEDKDRLHVPWSDIVKISYKKDKFRIIYHPPQTEAEEEDSNSKRLKIKRKFYTGPRPQAKRVWKNAVEQHVFFHLDSTKTPTIVSNLFLRSSMRYSFKKTLPSARRDPEPVNNSKTGYRGDLVPKEPPKDEGEEWVILQHPPLYDPEASKQQEHQRVQVDFKSPEDEPDAHQFIIRRDEIGSLELIDAFNPKKEEEKNERTYSLSVVNEDSTAATVSVSLNIAPPSEVTLSSGGQEVKGVPVFDSDRMPVVNVGSSSMVTTTTIIEQDGKKVSTGDYSQKYPLEEVTSAKETEEKWAGTPGGGADEAEQVNQFLEKERQVFENTMENASNREEPNSPPSVEIEVS